jgi:hypothetical protein
MPVELTSILCQLEHPFEVLDLLRDRRGRDLLVETTLNEPLTMLIAA